MSLYQDPAGSEIDDMGQQLDNFPDQHKSQTGSQPSVGNIAEGMPS